MSQTYIDPQNKNPPTMLRLVGNSASEKYYDHSRWVNKRDLWLLSVTLSYNRLRRETTVEPMLFNLRSLRLVYQPC